MTPITITVLDGGLSLDPAAAHEQEQVACAEIAEGVQRALTRLSLVHPHRDEFLSMLADFRLAAGTGPTLSAVTS